MLYHFSVKCKEDFVGMQSEENFQQMEPVKDMNSNKEHHNGEPTTVQDLQAALFPPMVNTHQTSLPGGELGFAPATYFSGYLLKTTNPVLVDEEAQNARLARIRDPKDLFQLSCPTQPARWPAECQVMETRIEHITYNPPVPEQYYVPNLSEAQPKPLGEEFGAVVYNYFPATALNYFNRSCTGGNKIFMQLGIDIEVDDLRFESRFESGNLAKAIKLTSTFYELYVRHDLYTNRHTQWFYFRISNVKRNVNYRFSIVNLSKGDSLYNCGMRPLMYSTKDAKLHSIGWRRWGDNIAYFSNDSTNQEDDQPTTYTLTFTIEFPHDNDEVYLAHSYPYTYTDLQDYLTSLANHPIKSTYTSLRLLCRSLAGNNIYYITITSPMQGDVKKKAIVLTARVHPGESPSSWIMKGLLDFLTGDTGPARELRDKFIFKLVPMLNPDGVIVGNSRCSLTGRDLNRQYRTVIRETYPSIWYTKLMVRRLIEECGVAMYCDIHAHSRQNNVFIYGCENRKGYDRYLQEQVFPLMLHKNAADKFSFEHCKFRIQRAKEGTGRVVMWMMGICNSYTMEASFAGVDMGPKEYTHFSTNDYEQMGKAFCQTLIDFYDETPNKEKLRCKILKKLLKEGSTADEPTNINISDYSSDEGDTTSSDEGAGHSDNHPFLVPPPSPSDKPTKKKPPLPAPTTIKISNLPKSPLIQRKVLPYFSPTLQMFQATLGFSVEEDDSSGDSDTPNECIPPKLRRPKSRKVLRKKKSRKSNKVRDYHDFSDTEIFNKKSAKCNVLELAPTEKVRSQSWSRYTGFPIPKYETTGEAANQPRVIDVRNTAHTTKNLAEVQAKLVLLRRRIWSGSDTGENIPLSCGFSNCIATSTNLNASPYPPEKEREREKEKPNKKSKDEEEKQEKKSSKKKSKRQNKEEAKRATNQSHSHSHSHSQTKKKSNGIQRQSAVDFPESRHPTIKSKSLQPTDTELRKNRDRYMSASESCVDIEDRERKKGKKKKKRKPSTWEKKIKTVSTITSLIRKKN